MKFDIIADMLEEPFSVSTPVGDLVMAKSFYRSCLISLSHKFTLVDLVELDILDFDVIFDMYWLRIFYASIDCRTSSSQISKSKLVYFRVEGENFIPVVQFVSCLKAKKMISKVCIYHIVRVKDIESETPSL